MVLNDRCVVGLGLWLRHSSDPFGLRVQGSFAEKATAPRSAEEAAGSKDAFPVSLDASEGYASPAHLLPLSPFSLAACFRSRVNVDRIPAYQSPGVGDPTDLPVARLHRL